MQIAFPLAQIHNFRAGKLERKANKMKSIVILMIIKIMLIVSCGRITIFPPFKDGLAPLNGDEVASGQNKEMLLAINMIRVKGSACGKVFYGNVSSLRWNKKLAGAARTKVQDLLDQNRTGKINLAMNTLPHIDSSGNGVGSRANAQGYNYRKIGENLAYVYVSTNSPSVKSVVENWKYSAQHCKALMDSRFKEIGVYFEGGVWAAVFAQPKS